MHLLVISSHFANEVPASVDDALELSVLAFKQQVEWPDAVLVNVLRQFRSSFTLAMAIAFKCLNFLGQQTNFNRFKTGADAHEAPTVFLLSHDPLAQEIDELLDFLFAVDTMSA